MKPAPVFLCAELLFPGTVYPVQPPFAAHHDTMRTFFRAHWKVIVAILLLVVLATLTLSPTAAMPVPALSARLRAHVSAIAAQDRTQAASYIENVLGSEGYRVRHPAGRPGRTADDIEVAVANVAPGARPAHIFIVGTRYDPAAGDDSGTAAVLELARLLKTMRPSPGTEVRFVFSVHGNAADGPDSGNFIAFVGSLAASRRVQEALSAFQAAADGPARGLAAPAYVQGVTLSERASWRRAGHPAVIVTDTAFMRYPYFHTADDMPDQFDYEGVARVVKGLARTITALAAGARA